METTTAAEVSATTKATTTAAEVTATTKATATESSTTTAAVTRSPCYGTECDGCDASYQRN
jgi:hypothetical protein